MNFRDVGVSSHRLAMLLINLVQNLVLISRGKDLLIEILLLTFIYLFIFFYAQASTASATFLHRQPPILRLQLSSWTHSRPRLSRRLRLPWRQVTWPTWVSRNHRHLLHLKWPTRPSRELVILSHSKSLLVKYSVPASYLLSIYNYTYKIPPSPQKNNLLSRKCVGILKNTEISVQSWEVSFG